MKRTFLNLSIDLTAALLFLVMLATAFVVWFAMPPGTNKSLTLLGLTRHQWGSIHAWFSLSLLCVFMLHLALHWQWVVSVIRKQLGLANATSRQLVTSGLVSLLIVSGLFVLFAWSVVSQVRPIESVASQQELDASGQGTSMSISGSRRIDFWKEVYPVLERTCLSCHGPKRQLGGFRVDQREQFFNAGRNDHKPLIFPGEGDESPLIAIVSGARTTIAFPDRHKLPEREIALLKSWIDQGADWPERREANEQQSKNSNFSR